MAKIVFMGTPDFALPALKALLDAHEVVGIVTQPDRRSGRQRRLLPSPVKRLGVAAGAPILQPARIRDEAALATLRSWSADLFVVAAYGQILPQALLDIPPFGAVNIHASLLPRWRGAAPIQAAIRAGDRESGVTIMLLDAGLDTGPTLAKRAVPLAADETGQSLHDRLAQLGAELLIETLPGYMNGEIAPQAQADSLATYAPRIKKSDGEIDWSLEAAAIERMTRAYRPWPGAFTWWNGAQLKIIAAERGEGEAQPGLVVERAGKVAIGAGAGLLRPLALQLAGKRRLGVAEFINGHRGFVGARLGR